MARIHRTGCSAELPRVFCTAAPAHGCVGQSLLCPGAPPSPSRFMEERAGARTVELNKDASATRESGASGLPCLSSPPQRAHSSSTSRLRVRVSQFPRHPRQDRLSLGLGLVRSGKTYKSWIPDAHRSNQPHLDCLSRLPLHLLDRLSTRRSTSRGAHRARTRCRRRWRWRVRREVS